MTRRRPMMIALTCLALARLGPGRGTADVAAASGATRPRAAGRRRGFPQRGPRAWPGQGLPDDRAGVPNWKVDEHFKNDVFTFVRVEYDSGYGGGGRWGGWGGGWTTDCPDSDLNFSFRLQQLTSLKVNPDPDHRCG